MCRRRIRGSPGLGFGQRELGSGQPICCLRSASHHPVVKVDFQPDLGYNLFVCCGMWPGLHPAGGAFLVHKTLLLAKTIGLQISRPRADHRIGRS